MPATSNLTRARRACIARALEVSEQPAAMTCVDDLAAAWHDVKAACTAAQRIDPGGHANAPLRAELDRRLFAIAARLDALREEERRRVVAQVMALAALGRAAGHAVLPLARDLHRATPDGSGDATSD
jgi:hypothetical protein